MRIFRRLGAERLPICRWFFRQLGYWPLRRHYYDPLFDPRDLSRPLDAARRLPGIEWNVTEQLATLGRMRFAAELMSFARGGDGRQSFALLNDTFTSGDADYLYSFVRLFKPSRVLEVGCGNSTRVIIAANEANRRADAKHTCDHVCIEPFEHPHLEKLGVRVIRERVELVSFGLFRDLAAGDLLFIDSSHIIRPCGDVLLEILEVLPVLERGVFVHFHDIFSPRHYLADWINNRGYLWNEQYLLEAFLSNNNWYKVVGALNYLHHEHYPALAAICASHDRSFEPGSFYIQRL
jgi:hypothetical protein